ncbi:MULTISPECIES: DUF6252 family protein [Flavobacterium]|uniref:DUF6252 family protein n=1 Tax=Flavobacterium TaxID=237 RepID=UPI0015B2DC58|nr:MULTISPECIES: DUF6252 family protein [Flavobacterium]MBN9283612.1 hypothetical protein [Flavobacterium sp.]
MKKIFSLIVLMAAFSSCEEDVKFNNPSLQGEKNYNLWRASDAHATIGPDGSVTIEGITTDEEVILRTSSFENGVYALGTTNQNNRASFISTFDGEESVFTTGVFVGPASKITLQSGGTGYTAANSAHTSGGSGSGLQVRTTVAAGVITKVIITLRGTGYLPGDIVTVDGGDNTAKFKVENVYGSDGEIRIEKIEDGTMTGKFKFNAKNANDSIVTYQNGVFYRIPIY